MPGASPIGARRRWRTEEHVLCRVGRPRLGEPAHRRHGEPRDARRVRGHRSNASRRCTPSPPTWSPPTPTPATCRRSGRERAGGRPRARGAAPPRARRRRDGRTRTRPARAPVIGFAFDGTGYGDDGTIWGGEVLIADVEALRTGGAPVVRAAARRRCRDPQPVPGRARPPVVGRRRLGSRTRPGCGPRRRRTEPPATATRARRRLRADLEHGPPVRCRRIAARPAPPHHLRGAGGDRPRDRRHGRDPARPVPLRPRFSARRRR